MKVKKFDQINVLPFIDIMLVLLVVVLTTASFVAKGTIPVDLPEASSKEAPVQKVKTIVIKSDGKLYFEDREVTASELERLVLKLDPKEDAVLIKSDAKSRFQSFVKVIDILKSNGFKKISIETRQ
ncbi:biopolymer transport protein ExbD/TolR [Hydrogenimonas sp.]|nr:biopolymer transport protein ExbD/TolR [Hydrogenimonas sp.]